MEKVTDSGPMEERKRENFLQASLKVMDYALGPMEVQKKELSKLDC